MTNCLSYDYNNFCKLINNYFKYNPPNYFYQGYHNFVNNIKWEEIKEQLFEEYDELWKVL